MRQGLIGSAIAAALIVAIVGGLAATTGIGDLEIFTPDRGAVAERLSTVEDFLADNSEAVKTELSRMQGEIDALAEAAVASGESSQPLSPAPEASIAFSGRGGASSEVFERGAGRHEIALVFDGNDRRFVPDNWKYELFRHPGNELVLEGSGRGAADQWRGEILINDASQDLWFRLDVGDDASWQVTLTRIGDTPVPTPTPTASVDRLRPCATAAEEVYLQDFFDEVDALGAAFTTMGNIDPNAVNVEWNLRTVLEDFRVVTQNLMDLVPPQTDRAQAFHEEVVRLSELTSAMVDAFEQSLDALNDREAQRLADEAIALGNEIIVQTGVVLTGFAEYCEPQVIPTSTRTPTAAAEHELVEEFGCQWIMDTYRSAAVLGRDFAIQNLATSMSLKRQQSGGGFSLVLAADAAEALRECEARGFE